MSWQFIHPAGVSLAETAAMACRRHAVNGTGAQAPRCRFNLIAAMAPVCELVASVISAPAALAFAANRPLYVTANPQDVFRALFHLLHVSITTAHRAKASARIRFDAEVIARTIVVRIVDDTAPPRAGFRPVPLQHYRSLAVARALAARNGGSIEAMTAGFILRLPAAATPAHASGLDAAVAA